LDIKRFTGAPETRLRRALDNPAVRGGKRRSQGQNLEPFHLALYEWQKNKSQNVYDRIIKPALYEDKDKVYLNAGKFRSLLENEPKESSIYVSPSIEPDSESEAIAIFGFAFGHLQPKESYDILEPLLSIGAQFREFFGATELKG
jgi:superfamily I DNA and/or RNA helicase